MLIDPQAMFVMCSFCYAQCPSYLLPTIFMSPCILQHCTKFDSCTMATLKKLFIIGSFDIMAGHLVHC
jgi:succinate dehydrogenase/fumarate reductase-like Fe-S protein